MKEITAQIDQIIQEHEQIAKQAGSVAQAVHDLEASHKLERAKDGFHPGRFEERVTGLQSLQEVLVSIDQGLQMHFDREEGRLLSTFEKYRESKIVSALRTLFLEHKELKERMVKVIDDVSELVSSKLSAEVWGGKAWDMQAHINHTLKLLAAHAQNEQELFINLKNDLREA